MLQPYKYTTTIKFVLGRAPALFLLGRTLQNPLVLKPSSTCLVWRLPPVPIHMSLSAQIIQHVQSCILEQCTCRDFCSAIQNRHLYPLVPEHWGVEGTRGETWLDGTVDDNGAVDWFWWPCASVALHLRQTSNTYQERGAHVIKTGNLVRHQESDAHKDAVCFCLAIDRSVVARNDTHLDYVSPPARVFEQIFKKFKGGEAPDKGYDLGSHVVAQHKAEKVLWMLHEAITEDKRTCLSNATIINLMRDERALKEHIRFRCCNEDADLTTGFLGQALLDPSSIGINKATHEVIKKCMHQVACYTCALEADRAAMSGCVYM